MKLWNVFFLLIISSFTINAKLLTAENINQYDNSELEIIIKQITAETEINIILLVAGICKYFEMGYTAEEIIQELSKQKPCHSDVEKMVQSINRILNKQSTKKVIKKIIVNNKQSEQFYALKNLKEKIKIIITIAILVIISGGVFKFYSKITNFFKNFCISSQPPSNEPSVRPPPSNQQNTTLDPQQQEQMLSQEPQQQYTGQRIVGRPMFNEYSQKRLVETFKQAELLAKKMREYQQRKNKNEIKQQQKITG